MYPDQAYLLMLFGRTGRWRGACACWDFGLLPLDKCQMPSAAFLRAAATFSLTAIRRSSFVRAKTNETDTSWDKPLRVRPNNYIDCSLHSTQQGLYSYCIT